MHRKSEEFFLWNEYLNLSLDPAFTNIECNEGNFYAMKIFNNPGGYFHLLKLFLIYFYTVENFHLYLKIFLTALIVLHVSNNRPGSNIKVNSWMFFSLKKFAKIWFLLLQCIYFNI